MNDLKEILDLIMEIANKDISNSEKHKLLSELWTNYYKLANKLNIELDDNISLLLENVSFIIKQDSIKKEINCELLNKTIEKIKNNCGITEDETINLLNWTIENTKSNLSTILNQLGKEVESDSLASFCEVAQALTLMPLENIGIKVTKNNASNCFDYPYNHAFGTATFDIIENGNIVKKTYLIDATYRQFFTTSRCNEGMYYKKDSIAPDPGYFVNEEFAKELLKNGYIELNETTAKLYGLPFYKSSLPMNSNIEELDYYNNIIYGFSMYLANPTDIEGFNLDFPKNKSRD